MEYTVNIPEWQLKDIDNTLRLVSNTLNSSTKETCLDRCVVQAQEFVKDALAGKFTPPNEGGEAIKRLEEVWGDDKDGKYANHYDRISGEEAFAKFMEKDTKLAKREPKIWAIDFPLQFKCFLAGRSSNVKPLSFEEFAESQGFDVTKIDSYSIEDISHIHSKYEGYLIGVQSK